MTPLLPTPILAAASILAAAEPQRSWWPWLAGFLPGLLVIAVAYAVLRWLRRRR